MPNTPLTANSQQHTRGQQRHLLLEDAFFQLTSCVMPPPHFLKCQTFQTVWSAVQFLTLIPFFLQLHMEKLLLCTKCAFPIVDLTDSPLTNPMLLFFYRWFCIMESRHGMNCVGFALCSSYDTLVSSSLLFHLSDQAAELFALTEACKLAAGRTVSLHWLLLCLWCCAWFWDVAAPMWVSSFLGFPHL